MTDNVSSGIQLGFVMLMAGSLLMVVLFVFIVTQNLPTNTTRKFADSAETFGLYTVNGMLNNSMYDGISSQQFVKTMMISNGAIKTVTLIWFERREEDGVDVFDIGHEAVYGSPWVKPDEWDTSYDTDVVQRRLLYDFSKCFWTLAAEVDDDGFYHIVAYQSYYQGLLSTGTLGEFTFEDDYISYPMVNAIEMFK